MRSAAVPRRLGYSLEQTITRAPEAPGESGRLMIWAAPTIPIRLTRRPIREHGRQPSAKWADRLRNRRILVLTLTSARSPRNGHGCQAGARTRVRRGARVTEDGRAEGRRRAGGGISET